MKVVSSSLVDTTTGTISIGINAFPGLGGHLRDAVQWRIRSCSAVWTCLDAGQTGSIGMVIQPNGNAWKPANFHDLKTKGGVIKLIRNSDWRSNVLGAQDEWVNHAASAGVVYFISVPDLTNATLATLGMITLDMIIQLKGHRE